MIKNWLFLHAKKNNLYDTCNLTVDSLCHSSLQKCFRSNKKNLFLYLSVSLSKKYLKNAITIVV